MMGEALSALALLGLLVERALASSDLFYSGAVLACVLYLVGPALKADLTAVALLLFLAVNCTLSVVNSTYLESSSPSIRGRDCASPISSSMLIILLLVEGDNLAFLC